MKKTFEGNLFDTIRSLSVANIKKMLDNGADVNVRNKIGRTPLINSVCVQNTTQQKINAVVRLLVDYGADLNSQCSNGDTALYKAAKFNKILVVDELTKLGAEWYILNENGEDFLDLLNKKFARKLKKIYPEKYEDYLMKKEASNFNL